jgi:hypothetical protein
MSGLRIAAIVLIAVGVLGLIYGQFSYTKETHKAEVGSLELAVKDKETVNVPQWAGILAIAGGAILLVVSNKRA